MMDGHADVRAATSPQLDRSRRDIGAMWSYFGDRRHGREWLREQILNNADVNWDPSLGQVCVIPVM
jgi:hypothetical protein